MRDKKIVLFDGVCNFCNYWVRFIFKRNPKRDIFFMPLQDERMKKFLPTELAEKEMESVIYYRKGEVFTLSTAALQIGAELNFFWRTLSKLGFVIPKKIRDNIYKFIGERRYSWFGKKEECPLPSPELRKQFL